MSVSGDSAEQVVRLSLEGFEVIAKLTGSGAKNVAALLYTMFKDNKQIKGKTSLNNMIKSGKALKIFSVKQGDLSKFTSEAKKYGILFNVLVNKKDKDPNSMVDIMVRDEDAPRINRLVEKFKLTTIDTAHIETVVQKSIEDRKEQKKRNPNSIGVQEKTKEQLLEDVLSTKPIQKENNQLENFNLAMTAKSPQSELSSNKAEGVAKPLNKKKSVRKELAEIKEEVRKEADKKALTKDIKEVVPKANAPKVKESR